VAETEAVPPWPWVTPPSATPVPILATLPHGGREYPAHLAGDLVLRADVLWSDWLTSELYAFLPELGVTSVSTPLSRFVADVNRDPAAEQHGGFWTSVVAAKTPRGQPLYRAPLPPDQIRKRIALAHTPFHEAVDEVVANLIGQFGRVLLVDLHSFGIELGADVVLGDRHGTTASPAAVRLVADALTGAGFAVRSNERFTGGWTVRRFAADPRVDAIQVELQQRCYLDWQGPRSGPPEPGPSFAGASRRLSAAFSQVIADLGRTIG
jgi:N-formylglutamate deformylase